MIRETHPLQGKNCYKPGEQFCNGAKGREFDLQHYPYLQSYTSEKPTRNGD